MTLPWDDNSQDKESGKSISGWRLCPSTVIELLDEKMEESRDIFFEERDSFLDNYDTFIEVAERKLGTAFNEEDYPSVDTLKSKFQFDFKKSLISEITSSKDIRLDVSEKMKASIQKEAVDRVTGNIKNVLKVTVDALLEQVKLALKHILRCRPTTLCSARC